MMTPYHTGMSPIMVDALLYLKENCHLWTIKDVSETICRVKDNKKKSRTVDNMRAHQDEEKGIAASQAVMILSNHSNVFDYGPELEVSLKIGQAPVVVQEAEVVPDATYL